eukprot:Amastigsp_a842721_26.p3 type:complete len:111 gc:universal Amastigsp_a842721_26:335-3(-)
MSTVVSLRSEVVVSNLTCAVKNVPKCLDGMSAFESGTLARVPLASSWRTTIGEKCNCDCGSTHCASLVFVEVRRRPAAARKAARAGPGARRARACMSARKTREEPPCTLS